MKLILELAVGFIVLLAATGANADNTAFPSKSTIKQECASDYQVNDIKLKYIDKRNREIKVAIRITKYTKAIPYEYEELSYELLSNVVL